MTETVSSLGLTTQSSRPSRENVIGDHGPVGVIYIQNDPVFTGQRSGVLAGMKEVNTSPVHEEPITAGQTSLSDAQKQVLSARMKELYPEAGIDFLIPLGADAVASELAGEH